MNKFNVNVVVVTYNRIELLKECIEALEKQTYFLNKIIIIENCSNDGTRNFLKQNYESNDKFIIKYMNSNIGGAGGFYEGIKEAIKYECDWIWLMDDDTIPLENSLECMLENKFIIKNIENIGFLASNVLWKNNEAGLINIPKPAIDYNKFLDFDVVKINASTFVSFLVKVDVVKKVGLPYKEFFIWGDDTEYSQRISEYGFDNYLINKSKVIHKRRISQANNIVIEDNKNRLWLYEYDIRNHLYLAKKKGIKQLIKQIVFLMQTFIKIINPKTKYKYKKIKILIKNIYFGIVFNPKIDKI